MTRVNAFYIHSDLVLEGLTVNNAFGDVLTEVQIAEPPGSLIIYRPVNPFKLNGNHLKYGSLQLITFRLTDELNRPIDTNEENFSFSVVVTYKIDTNHLQTTGMTPTTYSR